MSKHTVAIIQARMGSSRLPGKVLLSLDCKHVLAHDVRRVSAAETIDTVVIATSTETADDIIEQFGTEYDIPIYRGSEANVQQRMFDAATAHDADTVVRITADCPLIDPETIDAVVSQAQNKNIHFASNTIQRTFPRGLDVEAFSYKSFKKIVAAASTKSEREHVTPYYYENPDEFNLSNIVSEDVFSEQQYYNRTDLRLTLDEAADYRLFKRIYDEIEYTKMVPIREVIKYIDVKGLAKLNESVHQKKV